MATEENNTSQSLTDAYGPKGGVTGSGSVSGSASTPAELGDDGRPKAEPAQEEPKDEGTPEGTPEGDQPQEGDGGQEGGDEPKDEGGAGDEWTPLEAPTEDALKENLAKAGGFYAEAEYLPLAMEFETSFAKTGKGEVSEAAMQAYAEAKGLDISMVKAFIENANGARQHQLGVAKSAADKEAQAQAKTTSELHTIMGGEDEYAKFTSWAAGDKAKGIEPGLTAAQAAAYNKALDNDPETAKVLLASFKAAYQEAGHGQPARDITAQGNGGRAAPSQEAPKGYATKAEMDKAFADPRYHTDAAYRAEVASKAAASSF